MDINPKKEGKKDEICQQMYAKHNYCPFVQYFLLLFYYNMGRKL